MTDQVKPIPDGCHVVTPYLIVSGVAATVETLRMEDGGRIGHAEIRIGDSVVMLADENPEIGARSPLPERGHAQAFDRRRAQADRQGLRQRVRRE